MSRHPVPRRDVLRSLAALGTLTLGAAACGSSGSSGGSGDTGTPSSPAPATTAGTRTLGAEWDDHARTFMCWPASTGIWGDQLPAVRTDVATVAQAIAGHEHVVLLARPDQQADAQAACGAAVEVLPIPVDDLWARDTLPVFVTDTGRLAGVDLNFNGWGNKQQHADDAKVAQAVLQQYGLARIVAAFVAEGGALETDGQGTLLATESSLVNDNRNPGKSRQQIEDELIQTLGVTRVVWFTGVKGQDITDAHVDCLVRYTAPGVVLLDTPFPGSPPDVWSRSSDQARGVLGTAVDARGRSFDVVDLPQPDPDLIAGRGDAFLSSYANFFIGNGAVYVPMFGDPTADDRAQQILGDHFPGRVIVPLQIDAIAAGGGGIHCSTHDMPAAPAS